MQAIHTAFTRPAAIASKSSTAVSPGCEGTRSTPQRRAISSRCRGLPRSWCAASNEPSSRAKATWARLIRKVYEADPLICPECQGPMRVIAIIDDPQVVRRILDHLGRWAPLPAQRVPPDQPDWPPGTVIPLTYHPVPDIA